MRGVRSCSRTLVLSSVLFSVHAGATTFEDRVQQIETAYQQTKNISAEFVQTTRVEILDKTVTRHGRFFYATGGKLRIEYSGDPMTHYISDGKNFWVWEPKNKRVATTSLTNAGLPDEALNFLGGLGQLRKSFDISPDQNNGLKLKPKKKSSYRYLKGQFNEEGFLTDLLITNFSGNISQYRFFHIETDKPLSDKLFLPPL